MAKILIIDDSLTVRMNLKELFEEAGHQTAVCPTAEVARQELAGCAWSLIVLDVLLPDADGIELLRELKSGADTADVPVVLLSTEVEVRDRLRGLSTGADDYVGKPYDTSYLISRTNQLLNRNRAQVKDQRSKPAILVIDDSPTFRHAFAAALESAGYEALLAPTGELGLRMAAETRPDAVVVDGVLPGINGRTVIHRMKSDGVLLRVPCLLLTGSEEAADEVAALEAGADGFVRKGDDIEIILARLATVMRSQGAPISEAVEESIFSPKKILAVDDSPTYLQELAEQLRSAGNDVVLARSGEEALELVAATMVDCILLDLIMPGLSGVEVCQQIKTSPQWRNVPLIMLTACDDREAMVASFNAGADDFISKSSEPAVLHARLRGQLRRRQFEDENLRIRQELHQREIEAAEARANRELAETRARLLADLKQKNVHLEEAARGIQSLYHELEERAGSLQQASEIKSQFISYISHEFRTPLTSIISLSRMLIGQTSGPLTVEQGKQASLITESSESLLAMVDDLLDSAKVDAGKFTINLNSFDAASLFGTLRGLFQPLFADRDGLCLVFEEVPDLPPLYTDEAKVAQILRNLISNAMKFTESGEVRVAAVAAADTVTFSVTDNGIGIAPDEQERIFEDFTQVDSITQRSQKGTGLGLPLSRKLAEVLGGRLQVSSQLGIGSTFRAEIPIRYSPPESSRSGVPQRD